LVGLVAGGIIGSSVSYVSLNNKIEELRTSLQAQLDSLPPQNATYVSYPSTTYLLGENVSLSQLYDQIKDSVVVIHGLTVQYDIFRRAYYSAIQGSGFVYNFEGKMVIITNNHVVQDVQNISVTFINGNAYAATVLGSDPYADLAVLSTEAPADELIPLEIVDSSTLNVGDSLIAVGGPYGLAGTLTTGVVSALGRTISEDLAGGYPIANVIQTTTPINAGNSGGPLLNYRGQVVGITTAIVSNSQGLGFAIPSSTILREIASLVNEGHYDKHPTIGASGIDMTYDIAKATGANVTYGWLVASVTAGGPAANAGLRGGTRQIVVGGEAVVVGGDIIVAINGVRITNLDDLSTYLEEHTKPGDVVTVTIFRDKQMLSLQLTIGSRPATASTAV
ncbi:MAG: S1C family serine protease, partial [Candidatus Bathyarchaeia archaeon]